MLPFLLKKRRKERYPLLYTLTTYTVLRQAKRKEGGVRERKERVSPAKKPGSRKFFSTLHMGGEGRGIRFLLFAYGA